MAALIIFGLVALAVAVAVLYVVAHAVNKIVRFLRHFTLLWRFLAGHPLDGVHRTNATFWRAPTKALHPTADKSWWHWRPGHHRSGIRLGAVTTVLAIGAGLILDTTLTLVMLAAVALGAALFGLLWAHGRVRAWQHYRTWERPLHRALTPVLGGPPARLAIERDRSAVTLHLPEAFTGDDRDREAIVRAVTTKLALEAPDVDWSKLHGKTPLVTFARSQPPPSRVLWADVEQAVRGAAPNDLMCGLGKKHAEVFVSTTLDSPHFGIAMGTGGGKSNTAAFWLVQELRRGAVAFILDAKWFSHPWTFKDMAAEYGQLPNVAYARTNEQLHAAMVWLGTELQRRTEVADRYVNAKGDILGGDIGPTIWIIAEELNLATPRLKQYWASIRDKEDPKRSPALDGLAAVSFAGRAVRMHLIVIGQMLTAASLGGGDVRENIGVRMMARYTANSWKMQTDLAMPPSSDIPGRVQVIASGSVKEAQVPLIDTEWCREEAVSGIVTACPADMPGIANVARVALPAVSDTASELGFVLGHAPGRPPGTLTLREATAEGLFPSLPAARKAVQRRELEPAGKDGSSHLYYLADLAKTLRSVS